jgi:Uncharacterized conserved protein
MPVNPEVKAKAEALAEALARSEEYAALKAAQDEVEQHEAAKIMLRDFRQKQAALERKMLSGETPSEEEVNALQQAYQIVALNPYIRKLIEAEVAFAAMMAEVQRILAAAVGVELPDDALFARGSAGATGAGGSAAGGQDKKPDDGGSARSRLWVPGR